MVKITIKTDNEAFDGVGKKYEVARILRELADKFEVYGCEDVNLFDWNGNQVGECKIT